MEYSTGLLKSSILIVDDDPDALEEISDGLQDYGLTVYTAINEVIALELALEHRPEFVIMDYLLRGYTGVEAIKEIHKFLPETKVIMMSAFEDLSKVVTSTDSSVIAVLKKPLSIDIIGRFITNQLEHKRHIPKSKNNNH